MIGISQCIVSSSDLLNLYFWLSQFHLNPLPICFVGQFLEIITYGWGAVGALCSDSILQRAVLTPVITGGWFSSSKYHSVQGRTKTNKANSAFEFRTPSEKKKCPFRPGHQLNCRVPPPPPQSTFHRWIHYWPLRNAKCPLVHRLA